MYWKNDDCLSIGELILEGLPGEQTRSERLKVDLVIDANGMVTATATDKVSGKSQTVSVDYRKGIKPKDKPARLYTGEMVRFYVRDERSYVALRFWAKFREVAD